ncbi:MAG: hypothetical protein Hyperionvirus20_43 [Hyperionvirus sp.]|uniref:Uncharacterized protein n=1 Tax=Hyperionvirus sp. TaxID=2487770 RepID=A0A3G5AAJ6_9VIRU|nr:MAG: hypothetical protein Hyperionvirus20_43 [Hyperionvirus sp.]
MDTIEYKNLCKLDHQRSEVFDFSREKTHDSEKAMFIYKNIEKMDIIERQKMLFNLLSEKRITGDLMKYELKYLTLGIVIDNFDEFANFVAEILKRYHMKAGGFVCEDTEWTLHRNGSGKYPLKENEVIFENSLKRVHQYDSNIGAYIDDLIVFFRRHATPTLSVSYRLLDTTDDIYWMIFKIKKLINK